MRKLSLSGLVAGSCLAAALAAAPAHAATINVRSDAGTLGAFRLTNVGGGNFELDLTPEPEQHLQRINGNGVGDQDASFGPLVKFKVTATGITGKTFELSSDDYTKQFNSPDFGGDDASLIYSLSVGSTGDAAGPGPGLEDILNLGGLVSAIGASGQYLDLFGNVYDFAPMVGGVIALTLTGQDYGPGLSSMADVMNGSAGAWVTGTAAFSQGAVPEPTSVALLGIGLTGLIAFRRRFAGRARHNG